MIIMSYQTLTLEPDNPSNTVIRDEDGKALYTVETVFPNDATVTIVKNGDLEEIASLEWRDVFSDKLTFTGEKPKALSSWLKRSLVPFNQTVSFHDQKGRKYQWHNNEPGLQLQLFAEDSAGEPIARFVKSLKTTSNNPQGREAQLLMSARALEIRDDVVLSFLFLEKSRRIKDTSTTTRADALAACGRLAVIPTTSAST